MKKLKESGENVHLTGLLRIPSNCNQPKLEVMFNIQNWFRRDTDFLHDVFVTYVFSYLQPS